MKRVVLIILLIAYCFANPLKAQVAPTIDWQNTIGGSDDDWLYSVHQTNDGGYISGGYSNSNISGDKTENLEGGWDYWIMKCDAGGNIQWQNNIGANGWEVLYSMQQTSDGGYILGGYSSSNISGDKTENSIGAYDYWIVKIDSLGNIQWDNTIGGDAWNYLNSIQQTNDGGYILGGSSSANSSGDKTENSHGLFDYWIVKTDSEGIIQWQNTIGGNGDDELYSIQQTIDGGYILGGYSKSDSSGDKTEDNIDTTEYTNDYWIVKTDSSGNIQWENTIGGNRDDKLYSIRETIDGGFILGGYSYSSISGDKIENNLDASGLTADCWIVKADALGNIQWQKTIGDYANDFLFSIQPTIDAGYIIGGMTSYDYWLVKTDVSGNIQWDKKIAGAGIDRLNSVDLTVDGGFILGGSSDSNNSSDKTENSNGLNDYWILKLACEPYIFYADADSDGFGNINDTIHECITPAGYVANNSDCNDSNSDIHPNAAEICNGIDDNCNAQIDDGVLIIFYADTDSDSYGDANVDSSACTMPLGFVLDNSDCNDTDPNIFPGSNEVLNNNVDDDCDGLIDEFCSSSFILVADSLIPHHYWLISNVNGVPPINYLWSWGDGNTDTIAYPSHTYDTAGFYNICLFIVDSTGCSDSSCVGYELQKSEEMLTIITVDVVDSIPDVATGITSTNVLQSFSVYPNPASENVYVNYSLASPAMMKMELYDVLGNKLEEISNDADAGEHHFIIDVREFSNGVYYLKIQAAQEMISQKIILIK